MKPADVIHVIRRGDLASGLLPNWDDPEGVSRLTPEKRAALLDNPLAMDDDDPVQLVGTRDGVVAGTLELFRGQIHVGNHAVPTIWSSGYLVPERFRSSLIGVLILLELHRLNPTVGACGVSHLALPVVRRLKWRELVMPRYLLLLRSGPVLRRYLGGKAVVDAGSRVADLLLGGQRRLWQEVGGRRRPELRSEPVDRAPEELDAHLARLHRTGRAVPHRSAAWLNWLLTHSFVQDPSMMSALFLVRGDDNALLGYFLVKSRFYPVASQRAVRDVTLGSLQDWMIFDEARLKLPQLVVLAVRALERWSPDAIEVCTADEETGARLRRWGFPRAGDLRLVVRSSRGSALAPERFTRPEHWTLRPAEADNFFS
jgi:hypothetical protein